MTDKPDKPDKPELQCQFCGKPREEVKKMLTSSCGGVICTDCILQIVKMIFDENIPT